MANSCRQKAVDVSCRHFGNLSQVQVTISSIFQTAVTLAQRPNRLTIRPAIVFPSVVGKYLVSSIDCLKCSCSMIIHYIKESGIWRRCFHLLRQQQRGMAKAYKVINSGNKLIQLIFSNGKVSVVRQTHTAHILHIQRLQWRFPCTDNAIVASKTSSNVRSIKR